MTEKDFDLKKIAPLVSSELFKFVNEEIRSILQKVCSENSLDYNSVLEKHNIDILNIGAKFGVKKRNRRGRKGNTEFCKSHLNKLPHGRIDDEYSVKEPLKRGRKRKNNILKCNEYIVTHIEQISGNNYLVDDRNFVYSFDVNNPRFLGVKENETLKKIELTNTQIMSL